jgi:hypothetical protein
LWKGFPAQVVEIPTKGRSLIANRRISKDEVIFTDTPLVAVSDREVSFKGDMLQSKEP